jgi:hypothetical protein
MQVDGAELSTLTLHRLKAQHLLSVDSYTVELHLIRQTSLEPGVSRNERCTPPEVLHQHHHSTEE